MREQIKPTVERLFIGPLRDLVDTTFLLITRPASVAREFAEEDGHQFARAVTYFVAAFSAAVILENIAYWSLGLETFSEVPYWTINLLVMLSITALAVFIAFVLGSSPPVMLVKSACLAYGPAAFIVGFLIAGASLTLAALHELGYIPGLTPDLTSFENWEQIWKQAFFDCMRKESVLYDFAYQGFAASYQKLNYPLDQITKVSDVLLIAATVLFAVLAFYGTKRRHWAAAVAAVLSPLIVIAGTYFGMKAWIYQVEAASPCTKRSTQVAGQITAEDAVRLLADSHAKDIGKRYGNMILTGVEQQKRTLILRGRVSEREFSAEEFAQMMKNFRQLAIHNYCTLEASAHFRNAGASQVWLIQYANTELVERIVQSEDQCRR